MCIHKHGLILPLILKNRKWEKWKSLHREVIMAFAVFDNLFGEKLLNFIWNINKQWGPSGYLVDHILPACITNMIHIETIILCPPPNSPQMEHIPFLLFWSWLWWPLRCLWIIITDLAVVNIIIRRTFNQSHLDCFSFPSCFSTSYSKTLITAVSSATFSILQFFFHWCCS
jgi:hypothetical protein